MSSRLPPQFALVLLVAGLAWAFLHQSAFEASGLDIVPDSVEYALGAHSLVSEGAFEITLGGKQLPPWYAPWFSALVLAPAYVLFGDETGNAIYPVTALAVMGVLAAFGTGYQVYGALVASLTLLFMPVFSYWAKLIMTDVPVTSLLLVAAWLFLRIERGRWRPSPYAVAGLAVGLASSFRPLAAFGLLPFLWLLFGQRQNLMRRSGLGFLLVFPTLTFLSLTLFYHEEVFGSPFRTAYNYWCSVPYDYFGLTYSLGYFLPNLKALALSGFPLVALASLRLFVLERRACPVSSDSLETIRRLVGFGLAVGVPIAAIQMFYFFPETRFFLPLIAFSIVVFGSLAGRPIARFTSRPALPYVALLLAGVGCFRFLETDRIPTRRLTAERIAKTLPMNAAIVSSLDPVFLEHMLSRGRSDLRVIPLSRTVEYASKVITEARVAAPSPPPSSWSDHRCPGLFRGGAYDAVPFVASERITELRHLVEAGGQLYIDLAQVPLSDVPILERIRGRMEFTEIAPFFYRLSLSNDHRTGRGGP